MFGKSYIREREDYLRFPIDFSCIRHDAFDHSHADRVDKSEFGSDST